MGSKKRIAQLNDQHRRNIPMTETVLSPVVACLKRRQVIELIEKVRFFNQFDAENDPWAEHDFGAVEFQGETYYWKIDYYDSTTNYGSLSPDPSNPNVTQRVLTIMHRSEY
jgi:hypothetical protein